jgi:tetratricopeptide (TPR) repeat protein
MLSAREMADPQARRLADWLKALARHPPATGPSAAELRANRQRLATGSLVAPTTEGPPVDGKTPPTRSAPTALLKAPIEARTPKGQVAVQRITDALNLTARRQYDEAWKVLRPLAGASHGVAWVVRAHADLALRAGRGEEAKALLRTARLLLLDDPNEWKMWQAWMHTLQQRDLEAQEADYLRVLTDPYSEMYFALLQQSAGIAAGAQEATTAAGNYQRLILWTVIRHPNFNEPDAYFGLANVYLRQRIKSLIAAGDTDHLAWYLARQQAVAPQDLREFFLVQPALEAAGRQNELKQVVEQTAQRYRTALADYPRAAALHNGLAWLLARTGSDVPEAVEHAQMAVKLAPDDAAYLDTLAAAKFAAGAVDEALRLQEKCHAMRPDDKAIARRLEQYRAAAGRGETQPK